jgi:hypothetical protein
MKLRHNNKSLMNTTDRYHRVHYTLLAGLLLGLSLTNTLAQFSSGSDGSYLAMNITTNTTLNMPTNGLFNCTTINVASNATLTFIPNALNTPVYLLATGDVTVSGTIDVSGTDGTTGAGGAGGPGGFAGGNPGLSGTAAGDGCGPGAGRAGGVGFQPLVEAAGYATRGYSYWAYQRFNQGDTYGSPLLVPLVGGSGGGGELSGIGGAGGGGALLIASSTRIDVPGSIIASSPNRSTVGSHGFGSGGAVRLVAPVVAGGGTLNVNGGVSIGYGGGGGAGRIRIDCSDRRSLALTLTPSSSASIGSYMVVFPANAPRLDITQAAGNNIPVGTNTHVEFTLPPNSSTNQTVTVQASNFGAVVPIRLVLTPEYGASSSTNTSIDNSTINPASVTVPVVVPVDVRVQVSAWTR